MSEAIQRFGRLDRAALCAGARRLGAGAVLLLPVCLLYTRAGAEVLIALIDAAFLVHCAARHGWRWRSEPWLVAGLAWWAWMILCSLPLPWLGFGETRWEALLQAVLLIRFFVFAAALSVWLLREDGVRRWLLVVLAVTAGWIVVQCWQQYVFGVDAFGWRRWMDGALTGPFRQPRAGPALVLILFPAVLPATALLLRQRARWRRAAGVALFVLAVTTMVLIGQRMPALLTGLGLISCAVALPRLRPLVLGAAAAAAVLLVVTPLVSPPTFQKLVVHFAEQMRHFPRSPYGLLYARAGVIGAEHPVLGMGFDGFRHACGQALYQHAVAWLGLSDAQMADPNGCNIHPHNHYLEAFTSGGVPGLVLFCAMVWMWLAAIGRGLGRRPAAERVACLTAVLIGVWPFASTSAFFTLPNAGWLFLVAGLGLALAPQGARAAARNPAGLRYGLQAGD
jgi:O-antigen ligase